MNESYVTHECFMKHMNKPKMGFVVLEIPYWRKGDGVRTCRAPSKGNRVKVRECARTARLMCVSLVAPRYHIAWPAWAVT